MSCDDPGESEMNSIIKKKPEKEISWPDMAWDLLGQWKAVLITALAVMLLAAGAKYAKDVKEYKAGQKEKAAMSTASAEEQIEMILGKLPGDDRPAVLAAVNQKEMIRAEREYLGKSILMNSDPTNQRMLAAEYYIAADELTDPARAGLIHGYKAYLNSNDAVEKIGQAINGEAETNHIAELISVNASDPAGESDNCDAVLEVHIVLPEYADSEKVSEVLTGIINDCSAELSGKIGPHKVVRVITDDIHRYNADAVKKRNAVIEDLYTQQDNIGKIRLTEGQEAAVEAILAVKTASSAADKAAEDGADTRETGKPGISVKYAVFGSMLGILLYALIFFLNYIAKGRIRSAGDAEYYTQSRLLGEIYHRVDHKGLEGLLHSRAVDRYRYKGRLDEDCQIRNAASKTGSVCRRAGADKVDVLCLSELTDAKKKLIDAIKGKIPAANVLEVSKQTDEEELLSVRDAVLLVDEGVRADDVISLTVQLADCGTDLLGSIYCSCI